MSSFIPANIAATESSARVPLEIKRQLGVATLMGMGAHNLAYYRDALTFDARIVKPGTRQVRIMRVTITLTPFDLYDMSIGFLNKRTFEWESLEDAKDIYAETMVEIARKYV